jgi:hypothetical protein
MDAAYAFLVASLLLERAFDPLIVVPALLVGLICRRWLYVVLAAAAITGFVEAARYINNFHPALIAASWVAATGWGSLAYGLGRWLSRRLTPLSEKAPSP